MTQQGGIIYWDHSQLHREGGCWHHGTDRRGHSPSKADEASNYLLKLRKGEYLENSRDRASPKGRQEVKTVFWVSLPEPSKGTGAARGRARPLHITETFSAAPREVPAARELHFPELPSAPPPEASYRKHVPLPTTAGAGNPSAFAGVLRSWIKMDID